MRRPETGFTEKHFAVFAEEQHRRRLAGVVGGFPIPGAGRIGGAEGRLHRGAQDAGIDAAATFEIGKEKPRGLGDGGGMQPQAMAQPNGRPRSWKDSS